MDGSTAGSVEPPAKRQRVSTACDECRKRRVKCGGERPSCERCISLRVECAYEAFNDKRKPVTKDVVTALTLRIEQLEQELVAAKAGSAHEHPLHSVPPLPAIDSTGPSRASPFPASLALNAEGDPRLCGPTSPAYRSLYLVHEAPEDVLEASRDFVPAAPMPFAPPLDPQLPRRPPVLTQEFSMKLLRWAFEFAFSQFGLVEERPFFADLAASPTRRTEYYSPVLLHLVLGFGCRFLDPKDPDWPRELCSNMADPSTRGDVFIDWARLSLDVELRHPDISSARALMVLSVYLSGRGLDGPSLMYGAQASRMAEHFGLHIDLRHLPSTAGLRGDPAKLAVARRNAFWAAFQLDVMNNAYNGLRSHFTVEDINTALPAVDPQFDLDHPAYRSSSFLACSKLMRIQSKLISTVYTLKPSVSLETRRAMLPEVHLELEQWHHELPSVLRASTSTPAKAPHAHIIGLHVLYHAIVILLHRPFCRQSGEGDAMNLSTEKCLTGAKHIVRLVRLQREKFGLRFVMPHFGSCVLQAGTILVLSALCPDLQSLPSRDLERQRLARADVATLVSALREISVTWAPAERSARVLEGFARQWEGMDGTQPRRRGPARAEPRSFEEGELPDPPPLAYAVPTLPGRVVWGGEGGDIAVNSLPELFPSWDASAPQDDFAAFFGQNLFGDASFDLPFPPAGSAEGGSAEL